MKPFRTRDGRVIVDQLCRCGHRFSRHGNRLANLPDQVVPIANSALLSAKLLKRGTLKVYKTFPHGMCTTHADQVNPDLLAFFKS